NVAGEWRIRRILHAQVGPARIGRAQARVRIVGLDVLLQLDAQGGQVADFEHCVPGQLTLDREVPLQTVAGALVDVDSGRLDLYRPDHVGAERVQVAVLRNEVVAAE